MTPTIRPRFIDRLTLAPPRHKLTFPISLWRGAPLADVLWHRFHSKRRQRCPATPPAHDGTRATRKCT
jgi:hypothetical protein